MTCKDSHFLIGLGVGSILGALAYGFARSARAKRMKHLASLKKPMTSKVKFTLWLMKLRSNQSAHYRKNRGRRGIMPTISLFFHYMLVIEWASLTNEAG